MATPGMCCAAIFGLYDIVDPVGVAGTANTSANKTTKRQAACTGPRRIEFILR
jgi:hypothetical protein